MAVGFESLGVKTGAAAGSNMDPGGDAVLGLDGEVKELRRRQRDGRGCVEVRGDAEVNFDGRAGVGDGRLRGCEEDDGDPEERGEADGYGDGLPQAAHLFDGVGFDRDGELDGRAVVDGVGVEALEGDAHEELLKRPVSL